MPEKMFSYEVMEEVHLGPNLQKVTFYKRTRHDQPSIRQASERDVRELLSLGAAAAVSWLPASTWPRYTRLASRLRYRRKRKKGFPGFARAIRSILGIEDEARIEALFDGYLEYLVRHRFMFAIDKLEPARN